MELAREEPLAAAEVHDHLVPFDVQKPHKVRQNDGLLVRALLALKKAMIPARNPAPRSVLRHSSNTRALLKQPLQLFFCARVGAKVSAYRAVRADDAMAWDFGIAVFRHDIPHRAVGAGSSGPRRNLLVAHRCSSRNARDNREDARAKINA